MRSAGLLLGPPLWFKILYYMKQFVGGLVSPTEWIEGFYFGFKGVMFTIANPLVNWLWNFGDNIGFAVFEDDTTWGIFKAFSFALQGDFSQFVWLTSPSFP
jgi:hypothetical protein